MENGALRVRSRLPRGLARLDAEAAVLGVPRAGQTNSPAWVGPPDRCLHRGQAEIERTGAVAHGESAGVDPAPAFRSHRTAAGEGRLPRVARSRGRPAPRLASIRGALGPALAGYRAVRRDR